MRADLEANLRLRAVLDEVAARIGTRPVDVAFLLPGTEFAVMERGGLVKRMREAGIDDAAVVGEFVDEPKGKIRVRANP